MLHKSATARSFSFTKLITHSAQGAAIALAELVPGVSGGTIALVTGCYEQALIHAHRATSIGAALLKRDRPAVRTQLQRFDWWFVLPLVCGMVVTLLVAAGMMESFVAEHPALSRAIFFGMVLASLTVPFALLPRQARHSWPVLGTTAVAALLAWLATGNTGVTHSSPSWWMLVIGAALAVSALVLPGVSGSFVLLALGLYSPMLTAVAHRNVPRVGWFLLGAIIGLVTIVRLVMWLLTHQRVLTLAAMTGLMAGSLRALWPWQTTPLAGDIPVTEFPASWLLWLAIALSALAVLLVARISTRRQSHES
ncbi:DUF368 domain-containing protein [Corynebacterium choanae]|uniref:DUF368 domain-containing protein n=1 Tax=Corynebacterium choanae TaxID=1862358 RepID=A0A3G6J5T4_9CORY|nr:DUF368 domain-containing protein [Corynebacterium choanae]AZA13417.1 hypothetical protein CCHOA_05055 [Corynebacterium choanae]